MKTNVIPLRVPQGLAELASLCAKEQRTDRATTLRQWLYRSAEGYALKLVEEGRISKAHAAELLDLSIHEMQHLAESSNVRLGATAEQFRQSMEFAERLQPRDGADPER